MIPTNPLETSNPQNVSQHVSQYVDRTGFVT